MSAAEKAVIEQALAAAKSVYLHMFDKLRAELKEHLEVAEENLRALQMLEQPCHNIQKAALKVLLACSHIDQCSELLTHTPMTSMSGKHLWAGTMPGPTPQPVTNPGS